MPKNLRETISYFSWVFLICGIGYFLLPLLGYQIKLLMLLEKHFSWVEQLAGVFIILGAAGIFYTRKKSKDEDEDEDVTKTTGSAG